MVKFRNILFESAEIDDFLREIYDNKYIIPGQGIYRGYSRNVDSYKRITIRKDRRPLDTPRIMDSLAEAARVYYNSSLPSRRGSAFATSSEKYASNYGNTHYIFFRKKATVAWWADDTSPKYLGFQPRSLQSSDAEIINVFRDNRQVSNAIKFLDYWSTEDVSSIEQFTTKKFDQILKEMRELHSSMNDWYDRKSNSVEFFDIDEASRVRTVVKSIVDRMWNVKQYINNANEFDPHYFGKMTDILIEDDFILVVNKQWFDERLEFDYGSLKVK